MKIRQMGAVLFHADGRADMTKLIFAFCNFAIAPKRQGDISKSAKLTERVRSLMLSRVSLLHYTVMSGIGRKLVMSF